MNRIVRPILIFGGLLFILVAWNACSGSPPDIVDLRWRIIYRDDGFDRYEELAVFIRSEDPDGDKDLALLTITPRDTALTWRLSPEEWAREAGVEASWFGSSRIVREDRGRLPDTVWTVRLEDLAGRYDEMSFRIDADRPEADAMEWPTARIRGRRFVIEGPYEEAAVLFRNPDGKVLQTLSLKDGDEIGELSGAVTWEAWISLDEVSRGILLGPYRLAEE